MPFVAKRIKAWKGKLQPGKQYPVDDALKMVKEFASAKFNESVDAAITLGALLYLGGQMFSSMGASFHATAGAAGSARRVVLGEQRQHEARGQGEAHRHRRPEHGQAAPDRVTGGRARRAG